VFRLSYGAHDADGEAVEDQLVRWTARGSSYNPALFDAGWGRLVFIAEEAAWRRVPALAEVFTTQGEPCRDFNGRHGCGDDDDYAELYFPYGMVTAGWHLVQGSCTFTFAPTAVVLQRVLVWEDQMRANGGRCGGLQNGQALQLRDVDGTEVAAVVVQGAAGQSYQADAYGVWSLGAPTPGR